MKFRSIIYLCIISIAVLGFFRIAHSQPTELTEQATVYNRMSPKAVEDILRGMGFEYRFLGENEGHYPYEFQLGGYNVGLILYPTGQFIQMLCWFPMDPPPPFKAINDWNKNRLFSKAYFNDEGFPTIDSALDLTGGVSREAVEEFIRTFRDLVSGYVLWLTAHGGM